VASGGGKKNQLWVRERGGDVVTGGGVECTSGRKSVIHLEVYTDMKDNNQHLVFLGEIQ